MAKIKDCSPKNISGSYERIFGNKELAYLVSKVHSASIKSGNELEKIIIGLMEVTKIINNVDEFLEFGLQDGIIETDTTFLLTKSVLKKSKIIDANNIEPDYVIFKINKKKKHCYIIELKDGHNFDTKKTKGEKNNLQAFETRISRQIEYSTSIHICAFNKENKDDIKKGLKNNFNFNEILTGREFCELLNIDYDYIIEYRKKDIDDNINYFLEELYKIDIIKDFFIKKINNL